MKKLIALAVLVLLVGCGRSYTNVDPRTIDRANALCANHGGLVSVRTHDFYEPGSFSTYTTSQLMRVDCVDNVMIQYAFKD